MHAGAVWQDLRTGVSVWQSWERIALVTERIALVINQRWMVDGLKLFAWAVPGEARSFALTERADAVAWGGRLLAHRAPLHLSATAGTERSLLLFRTYLVATSKGSRSDRRILTTPASQSTASTASHGR
jgi:hypothetical protein